MFNQHCGDKSYNAALVTYLFLGIHLQNAVHEFVLHTCWTWGTQGPWVSLPWGLWSHWSPLLSAAAPHVSWSWRKRGSGQPSLLQSALVFPQCPSPWQHWYRYPIVHIRNTLICIATYNYILFLGLPSLYVLFQAEWNHNTHKFNYVPLLNGQLISIGSHLLQCLPCV